MKNVFLYSSSAFHNAHKHMIANVPGGFQYQKLDFMAVPTSSNPRLKSMLAKTASFLSPYYNYLHVVLGKPKVRTFYQMNCDIIHSAQCLLKTSVPYVVDFEHAAVFSGYNQVAYSNPSFLRNLIKILENRKLKRLLAWSNAAKMSLLNFVDSEEVARKTEVLYPVVTPPDKLTKKDDGTIKFLFVGGVFFEKGGLETLAAFDKISSKYDVELVLVSNVPEEIKRKYSGNPKIKIYGTLPYSEVQKLYEYSHIFVMPTHFDTFGFVIPEALSYGLPVISDNSFSRPELISHDKTGLLVDAYYSSFGKKGEYIYPTNSELVRKRKEACMNPPQFYINSIAVSMERMINDCEFRRKCSTNAIKETTEGKFSPKVWKEKMKRIYSESMQ